MSEQENCFTVVFRVNDDEKFKELTSMVTEAMFGQEMFGASVTGCRWGDSMTEADAFRDYIDKLDIDPEIVLSEFLEDIE